MENQMEILLSKINEKFNEQTLTLTTAITKNVMEALDDKLKIITEENNNLKTRVSNLEQKVSFLEKEKRKNNLVLFGIEEKGKTELELVDFVKEILQDSGTHIDSQEISEIHRIGTNYEKNRPLIISLTTSWKKHLILKNKRNLPTNVFVNEDYPKEVLEIRKQLKPELEAERKKGNIAFIKYDKLIVKKPTNPSREKRKRETPTGSPTTPTPYQKKTNTQNEITEIQPPSTIKGVVKPSILTFVTRERSASTSEMQKNEQRPPRTGNNKQMQQQTQI